MRKRFLGNPKKIKFLSPYHTITSVFLNRKKSIFFVPNAQVGAKRKGVRFAAVTPIRSTLSLFNQTHQSRSEAEIRRRRTPP